jgi:hypothetical protein
MLKKFPVVYHIIFAVYLLHCCFEPAKAFSQPINIKNHSPLWFGLLYPAADTAMTLPAGEKRFSLEFDYSNIFFLKESDEWRFLFDMEIAQYTVAGRFGLENGYEAGFEQSAFRFTAGFLDDEIINFHNTFGFQNYDGQLEEPRDRFLYSIAHYGKAWNSGEPGEVTPGDTTFWIKKRIRDSDDWLFSLKTMVQAPIAPTDNGVGNGSWEWGALLLAEKKFQTVHSHFNLGFVDPGYVERGEKYKLDTFYFFRAGGTYSLSNHYSLVLQGTVASVPLYWYFNWSEITAGLQYKTKSGITLAIAFMEDLSKTAPDFTSHLSLTF